MIKLYVDISGGEHETSREYEISNELAEFLRLKSWYDEVDEMPTYPGGTNALNNFVSTHMYMFSNYKTEHAANGGRITVEFIIEKDGSTSNHKVTKSSSPEYDADAIRLVKKMPKWTPGKLNGKTVRVRYSLPISYVMLEN